jgi:hypothetical protein
MNSRRFFDVAFVICSKWSNGVQNQMSLGYEVSKPASFLFNVAVAQNSFQRIVTEHFEVSGAELCPEMLIRGQRFHRLDSTA